MEEKRRIGALAADMVQDGEIIILDAGTTTTKVAQLDALLRQIAARSEPGTDAG